MTTASRAVRIVLPGDVIDAMEEESFRDGLDVPLVAKRVVVSHYRTVRGDDGNPDNTTGKLTTESTDGL